MRHILRIMTIAFFFLFTSHGLQRLKILFRKVHTIWAMEKLHLLQRAGRSPTCRGLPSEQAGDMWRVIRKGGEYAGNGEDEIEVLTSGIMEVEILDKKRTIVGDGLSVLGADDKGRSIQTGFRRWQRRLKREIGC